jgi:hypothetical protein
VFQNEGDLARLNWRKATYSVNAGACVQVASAAMEILVRDSVEVHGAVLRYPAATWQSFLANAPAARFDVGRP